MRSLALLSVLALATSVLASPTPENAPAKDLVAKDAEFSAEQLEPLAKREKDVLDALLGKRDCFDDCYYSDCTTWCADPYCYNGNLGCFFACCTECGGC